MFKNQDHQALSEQVDRLEAEIKRLSEETGAYGRIKQLQKVEKELREQIETLKIEKSRKEEDHAKQERELRHMVGLERERQKFEVDAAKREAMLEVREENLDADKKRFEEQMKFHEKRFTEEVGYLKGMLTQVLDRLPSNATPASPQRKSR